MLRQKLISFYRRNKDVLYDMIKSSKDREVAYRLENGNFGKRPYILENPGDIISLVNSGAISFHMSVERWLNPLELSTSLKKKQLNELRYGWDLIFDIDSKDFEISKYTAYLILKFLEKYEIKPIYLKYSGGKGFHIAIPWELFPDKVKLIRGEDLTVEETKNLFPELARTIASFVAFKIENRLKKFIEKLYSIEEIIKEYNLNILPEKFSPFHIVQIDTILISSRHLIRMPYSINEKTNLLSIPITDIKKFDKEEASLDYYEYQGIPFLSENLDPKPILDKLVYDSIKWSFINTLEKERIRATQIVEDTEEVIQKDIKKTKKFFKGKVPKEYFPPCIKNILNGVEDGRKRAVFILINFLANLGWSWEDIEKLLWEWNEKNPEPLRERYIEYQLQWHKERYKKGLRYLPPNCANEGYYKDMGVCKPDSICRLIKNPISYPLKKLRLKKDQSFGPSS